MIGGLIFALTMAAIGLVVLGERVGLGLPLASAVLMLVVALAGAAIAVSGITSRLGRFLTGDNAGSRSALPALTACLVFLGASADPARQAATGGHALALALGFVAAWLVTPFDPWRNFHPARAKDAEARADIDPATGTRGALSVHALAVAGLAVLLSFALRALPPDRAPAAEFWSGARAAELGMMAVLAIGLLGGMRSLARSAAILVASVVLLAVAPVLALATAGMVERIDGALLHAAVAVVARATTASPMTIAEAVPSAAIGAALAQIVHQPAAARTPGSARFALILLGLVCGLGLAALNGLAEAAIGEIIATRIVAAAPAQWPLFVFDDDLRGWLAACGQPATDALAAARACGLSHAREILATGSLSFDRALAMPALAASLGLPAALGVLWRIMPLLAAMLAWGVLVLSAASLVAEQVLFRRLRPRALRSQRLTMARLTLLGYAALLVLASRAGLRVEADLSRLILFGLTGTIIAAMLGFWLIRAIRFLAARRAARAGPDAPSPAPP